MSPENYKKITKTMEKILCRVKNTAVGAAAMVVGVVCAATGVGLSGIAGAAAGFGIFGAGVGVFVAGTKTETSLSGTMNHIAHRSGVK